MSPEVQTLFFALALVCLLLAAFGWRPKVHFRSVRLMPFGYALFIVPFFWQALEQALESI